MPSSSNSPDYRDSKKPSKRNPVVISTRERLQNEQNTRNELFHGGDSLQLGSDGGADEHLTVDQLVTKAEKTHEATTATANRALQVIESTKQVQGATLKELDSHNEQVDRMNTKLNKMNENLTYGEKMLRYMKMCCCVSFCDSCCHLDPEANRKREWEVKVDRGMTTYNDKVAATRKEARAKRVFKQESDDEEEAGPRHHDPDIVLNDANKHKELSMNAETRKQNKVLDQIGDGLGDILENAKRMGDSLEHQTKSLGKLEGRADLTNCRITDINGQSQLRHHRGRK